MIDTNNTIKLPQQLIDLLMKFGGYTPEKFARKRLDDQCNRWLDDCELHYKIITQLYRESYDCQNGSIIIPTCIICHKPLNQNQIKNHNKYCCQACAHKDESRLEKAKQTCL